MRIIAIISAILLSSCYNPNFTDEGFSCNKDGTCPSGFVCSGPDGAKVCIKEGTVLSDQSITPDTSTTDSTIDGSDSDQRVDSQGTKKLECSKISDPTIVFEKEAPLPDSLDFAFDDKTKALWTSILIKDQNLEKYVVLALKQDSTSKEWNSKYEHQLTTEGVFTAIDADNDNFALLYDDNYKKNIITIYELQRYTSEDDNSVQFSAQASHRLGSYPDIYLAETGPSIAIHQKKRIVLPTTIRYDAELIFNATPKSFENDDVSFGYDNHIDVNEADNEFNLSFFQINHAENKTYLSVYTGDLQTGELTTPARIDVPSYKYGHDYEKGHLVFGNYNTTTRKNFISYRAKGVKPITAIPTLNENMTRPEIAVNDELIAVSAFNRVTEQYALTIKANDQAAWSALITAGTKVENYKLIGEKIDSEHFIYHIVSIEESKALYRSVECSYQ